MAVLLLLAPILVQAAPGAEPPRLSEIVADPQRDWNEDGRITGTDEWIELENPGAAALDLAGWKLLLNDSTPATQALDGVVPAGGRRVVWNPVGDLNNNAHVALLDPSGKTIDELRFGTWPGSQAPTADASGDFDEALRLRDGVWARRVATPGAPNNDRAWRTSDAWTRRDGWTPPGQDAKIQALLLDGSETWENLRYVERHGTTNVTVAEWTMPDPTARLAASRNRTSGTAPFAYWWEAASGNRSLASPHVEVQVDAAPPRLPARPERIWIGPAGGTLTVGSLHDPGVGGARWRAHLRGPGDGAAEWSTNESLALSNTTTSVRLEVEDAFGNRDAWNQTAPVTMDATPPDPIPGLQGRGQGPFELSWGSASDAGSGVARLELVRDHKAPLQAWLPGNATSFLDSFAPGDARLEYRIRAHDAAGNGGAWTGIVVDHPGYRAHAKGLRLTRTVWASGALEARVDFDRRMALAPDFLMDGSAFPPHEGRFLANGTTYWARWSDGFSLDDGPHLLTASGAEAADGAPQREPAKAPLRVDHSPPALRIEPEGGSAPEGRVRLLGEDPSGATITWRLLDPRGREAARGGPVEHSADVELPDPGTWTLVGKAVDAHGHRAQQSWEIEYPKEEPPCPDVAPAPVEEAPAVPSAAHPPAAPLASATTTPPGTSTETSPGPCASEPPPAAPTPTPTLSIEMTDDPAAFAGRLEEQLAVGPPPIRGGVPYAGAAWAGLGVGGLALTVGIQRHRARRRSFAARLRRLRRATEAA